MLRSNSDAADQPPAESQPSEPGMQLRIALPGGGESRLVVPPRCTVGELKARLAAEGTTGAADGRLFRTGGGPELTEAAQLASCCPDGQLALVVSEPVAQPAEPAAAAAAGPAVGSPEPCVPPPAAGKKRLTFLDSHEVRITIIETDEFGDTGDPRRLQSINMIFYDRGLRVRERPPPPPNRLPVPSLTAALCAADRTKLHDGPSTDSALLDKLIVAFFEKVGGVAVPQPPPPPPCVLCRHARCRGYVRSSLQFLSATEATLRGVLRMRAVCGVLRMCALRLCAACVRLVCLFARRLGREVVTGGGVSTPPGHHPQR